MGDIQMTTDFSNAVFSTTYSFQSPRSIIRALSDAFSKQHCDTKGAISHAVKGTEGRCLYCGVPMYSLKGNLPVFSNNIHYDHIYPASKLNLFEVGNVTIACETCNLAKSDKFPMDYYDQRQAEGVSLFEYDREKFNTILNKITKPYKDKWPEHYEAGTRIIEDDDEFKELLTHLLYNKTSIASAATKYNHENSINRLVWERVIAKACDTYTPMTAKDVTGRVGYTNQLFEDMLGHNVSIEDTSIKELKKFTKTLLLSKYESKNEVTKYRMLIKMLVEVLSEDIMEGQLEGFYEQVPTYSKMTKENKENV